MSKGFSIHREAVLMEVYLNDIVRYFAKGDSYELADITMIYDAPITLIMRMLSPLKHYAPKNVIMAIIELESKYRNYENQILTQMERATALSLCSDLKMISSLVRDSDS